MITNLFARPLQALTLASALTLGAPLMTGCSSSSSPTDESSMVTTGTNPSVSSVPPVAPRLTVPSVLSADARAALERQRMTGNPEAPVVVVNNPSSSSSTWFNGLVGLLIGVGGLLLTQRHLRRREGQEHAARRAVGITTEEDIQKIETRLSASAGNRDHWSHEFLTDLRKVARNGLLRPARCRTEDIVDLMNLRKRSMPVINTVVAPSGAGKSRMVEGLVHSLYHDNAGRHFEHPEYSAKDRLFPDVDPSKLLCYRINLGQLTHADAEPMFHYLMQKADQCVTDGGRCLVIIDDVHYIYKPNGFASASRLIHLIDGWTDGQMKDNKGLWGIAMTPLSLYDELFSKFASRARRFERYDMPVLSGGRLRSVVDETLGEWENRLRIKIPEEVRDRAMELMHHPSNQMANPYAVLNLLDRVASGMPEGHKMTVDAINRSFAKLHNVSFAEISQWMLYAEVEKAIRKELAARFPVLTDTSKDGHTYMMAPFATAILRDWKAGTQGFSYEDTDQRKNPAIPEFFIEDGIRKLYLAISQMKVQVNDDEHSQEAAKTRRCNELMAKMKGQDAGPRSHRGSNVTRLQAAPERAVANG